MTNLHLLLALCTLSLNSAAISQRRAATWNLQGSSAATESKWSNNVRQLVVGTDKTHPVTVLSLQEAGTPPEGSAKLQGPLGNRLINPHGVHQEVLEYKWNLGTTKREEIRWIYYTHNDHGANRVNLAIVTKDRPDHVIIMQPPGDYKSVRPILGVQFQKDNYFTIHASASGGGDAAGIVNHICNYFGSVQEYDHQFMIMGDYNRNPDDLHKALERDHVDILRHIGIFHTSTPTQKSGNILDYAVIGQYKYDLVPHLIVHAVEAKLENQLVSDHFPVVFDVAQKTLIEFITRIVYKINM
ncbi:unnamed protein product [Ceutorhynchus assimilis]|uniref:Endonuclease/exonuclease/phosphatase domain-containing protein n=1 Tax=Ceutorhynchus assimilis TaxID=467358 RepID=A0A9N9QSP2_9CUCU|nr:unnamed protein product [Ceutorhynchus assimilis]